MTNNNTELSKPYQAFFGKFAEIDTLEVSQWKSVHLIAHMARRYKDFYGIDYTFRLNSTAPGKCYEMYQMGKLTQMITKDPTILKAYIDWVWQKKVIERKKRITSFALFVDANVVNEYKWQIIDNQIDRTTPLPTNILTLAQATDITIKSFGDLAFILQSKETKYDEGFWNELQKAGLDIKMLERIK